MDKKFVGIIGLGMAVAIIYTGLLLMYSGILSGEKGNLKKAVENSLLVETYSRNESMNIVTFLITEGGDLDMNETLWRLEEKNSSKNILLSPAKIEKDGFTDLNLYGDKKHSMYWYDAIGDGKIGKGDFIKVKAPQDGDYYLVAVWKGYPVLFSMAFHY